MRIEEGKFYRAANGEKIGPMTNYGGADGYPWAVEDLDFMWWNHEGKAQSDTDAVDLISEWPDAGPVRTVTRQEIVPGTYDGVRVGEVCNVPDCAEPDNPARVEVLVTIPPTHMTADELDRAAAVLTALAGALRDE